MGTFNTEWDALDFQGQKLKIFIFSNGHKSKIDVN